MSAQIRFLQGCSCGLNILTRAGFRDQMLRVVKGFSMSRHNGLFINSCFAHCQTERQDTWFADDSPVINKKAVAIAVGSEVSRLRVPLRQELPQLGVQMS